MPVVCALSTFPIPNPFQSSAGAGLVKSSPVRREGGKLDVNWTNSKLQDKRYIYKSVFVLGFFAFKLY